MSTHFANSMRSQRFLRYVVEGCIKNHGQSLKEYVIAVEVFDRDSSYDPAVDATVRVEAGRLRTRLRDYYAEAGRNDPLLIEIPRGSYCPTFTERAPGVVEDRSIAPPPEPPAAAAAPGPSRRWLASIGFAALGIIVLLLAGVTILRARRPVFAHLPAGSVVLAVLPFTNQTGSDANGYLTEGLTDNLIRQFSELPRLRVVSRAAVDSFDRKSDVSLLGITVLLTGQLQRNSDGRLVLNSELSNAKDGTVLRSNQYLPDEADFRPVQADIVHDVVDGLGMELEARKSVAALRPLTSSPAAFQDFLRGESEMQNGDEQSIISAIHLFQDAVQKDSSFAQAFASMAEAEAMIGIYFESPRDYLNRARQSARRAVALDPANAGAHSVLGLIHLVYDWDFAGAQSELSSEQRQQDAIWQLGCTAHLRERNGDTRQADEALQHTLEFNPNSSHLIAELGCINYYAGHYEDSIRYYRKSLVEAPQGVLANWGLGRSLSREGKFAEALHVLQHFNTAYGIEHPIIDAEIGYVRALAGDRAGALAMIRRLRLMERKQFVDPYFIAQIYLGLKDRENTYAWLDKAFDIRSPFLVSIATDPKWSSEQSEQRFQALWDRMTRNGQSTAIAAK